MKIAENFDEITLHDLPSEIIKNKYLSLFADKLMHLSNRLNEIDEEDEFTDDLDIKEDYLPAIREFIANITGL